MGQAEAAVCQLIGSQQPQTIHKGAGLAAGRCELPDGFTIAITSLNHLETDVSSGGDPTKDLIPTGKVGNGTLLSGR